MLRYLKWPRFSQGRRRTVESFLLRSFLANVAAALSRPIAVLRDWASLSRFRRSLAQIGRILPDGGFVPALHFVYGLKQVEELPFYVVVAILSAQARHPKARTFFYYHYEPEGLYWEFLKQGRLELVQVPKFEWFNIAQVKHYAHKADVVHAGATRDRWPVLGL